VTQDRLQVLVLDDEPIVGRRVKPALEKLGVEVEIFEDPLAAVTRLRDKQFDVVVTDLKMGKLDGMKLLEEGAIKKERTKVIIITGFATIELAREALSKGAFEFIAKPFKTRQLRDAISRAAKALGRPALPGFDDS